MIRKQLNKAREKKATRGRRFFTIKCLGLDIYYLSERLAAIKVGNRSPGRLDKYAKDYDLSLSAVYFGAQFLKFCSLKRKTPTRQHFKNYIKRKFTKSRPLNLTCYSIEELKRYVDSIFNDREKERGFREAIYNLFDIRTEAEFDTTKGKDISKVLRGKKHFTLARAARGVREVTHYLSTNVHRGLYLYSPNILYKKIKGNVFNIFFSRFCLYEPDIIDIKSILRCFKKNLISKSPPCDLKAC